MKQSDPRILDDLARMAGGAMNVFSSVREQIMNDARARIEEMAANIDLVPRADFNRLQLQVDALQKRLDALAPRPAQSPSSKTAKTASKSSAPKPKKPKKK